MKMQTDFATRLWTRIGDMACVLLRDIRFI
jgi:hypothetical protein